MSRGRAGSDEAACLEVRVVPKARKRSLVVAADGRLKAYVTCAPVGGKANRELLELVAAVLGVARSRVELVRGERSRDKLIRVWGVDGRAAREAVRRAAQVSVGSK